MPSPFDPAPKKLGALSYVIMGVLALVVLGGVYALMSRSHAQELARWTSSGPPCPEGASPYAGGAKPRMMSFAYGGAQISRRIGHADCAELKDGLLPGGGLFHVCHFTGPDVLHVVIASGETTYRIGVGKPATLTLRDGRVSCAIDPPGSHRADF